MTKEKELLSIVESQVSTNDIIIASKYINLNYNIFATDSQLWDIIQMAFGSHNLQELFWGYQQKLLANRFINILLLKYYLCERTVKYAIVNSLKNRPDTVLFEMPVLGSRIDVCRINGNSYAYEIKTELDTFKRLPKQIINYSNVFEYVYITVSKDTYESILPLIPDYCGICFFAQTIKKDDMKLWTKRKATKSPNINPYSQLQCFSSETLAILLKNRKIKKIPSSKEDRIQYILDNYSAKTINSDFKKIVKLIYKDNWEFIKKHYNEILPIDLQAFFNSNLDPNLLYFK